MKMKLKRFLTFECAAIVITLFFSLIALYLSYTHNVILSYNDGNAHLNTARRVIDNLTPGLVQLGSVWLPLFHILMIPLVFSDFLWKTGLAGSIINCLNFTLTGWLLYRLIFYLTENRWCGLVGVLLFATNANMLYMQTTPMDEPLLIVTSLASIYFICRWARENSLNYLIFSAFFIFLASLARYDGWSLFAAIAAYILFLSFAIRKKGKEGPFVVYLFLGGFGIFLWFLYNNVIFGDPFYFATGEYSARAQQIVLQSRGTLPTIHNLPLSTLAFSMTTIINVGLLTTILMVCGVVYFLIRNWKKPTEWGPLLLLVVFLFNVLALYEGHSVIWLPNIPPFFDTYFNARYGVLMIPAAAIFVGYLSSIGKWFRVTLIAVILFQSLVFLSPSLLPVFGKVGGITTMKDTVSSVSAPTKNASAFLHAHYKGGLILVSSASEDSFIFHTAVPLKNYITEGTGSYWKESLVNPQRYATWVVFFGNKSDRVGKVVGHEANLTKYFHRVYLDNTFEIWEKNIANRNV